MPVEPNSSDAKCLSNPKLSTRRRSGKNIVPRDDPQVEILEGEEMFDLDEARAMSPHRNSEQLEKMSRDAREELSQPFHLLIL
jgi:hypothetical protein